MKSVIGLVVVRGVSLIKSEAELGISELWETRELSIPVPPCFANKKKIKTQSKASRLMSQHWLSTPMTDRSYSGSEK